MFIYLILFSDISILTALQALSDPFISTPAVLFGRTIGLKGVQTLKLEVVMAQN